MKLKLLIILLVVTALAIPALARHHTLVTSVAEGAENGPDAQILKAVAKELDLDIVFSPAPFKRRLLMMKNGELDLICGLLKRPERQAYIHFIHPPYKTRSDTIFFVPKGQAEKIKTYDDLAGLRIGTTAGSKYFIRFDQDDQLIKESSPQADNNYKKMLLGRLDAVIQDEANGIELIHRHGMSQDIDMAYFRFSREKHVYFGISKNTWMMEDLDRITQVLEKMITSGRIKEILRTYYSNQGLPTPAM